MHCPNLPSHSCTGLRPYTTGRTAMHPGALACVPAPDERPAIAAPLHRHYVCPIIRTPLRPSDRIPQLQRAKHPPGGWPLAPGSD
ncbi:MAG: hypothetical protein OHK0022_34930 [Roseiflexaceae bacterium]